MLLDAAIASLIAAVAADVFATRRLVRCDLLSQGQRAAWIAVVWLVPIVGALAAVRVASESVSPPATPNSKWTPEESRLPGIGPEDGDAAGGPGPH